MSNELTANDLLENSTCVQKGRIPVCFIQYRMHLDLKKLKIQNMFFGSNHTALAAAKPLCLDHKSAYF